MGEVMRRSHGGHGRLVLVLSVVGLVSVTPAGAEDDEARTCLPSRGTDAATPPAVRLNGVYQMGNTGEPLRDALAGIKAASARFIPGATDAAGPARWLFDGAAEAQAGRHGLAQQHFTRCTTEAARSKDSMLEAACRNNLGAVAAARGRYAEARTWFRQAAQQYRAEVDRLPSPAMMEQRLARVAARFGSAVAASQAVAPKKLDRMPTQDEIQAMREQAKSGLLEVYQRDPEFAAALRERYVSAQARAGSELVELNLGNVAHALGQWEEALVHLKQALAGYDGAVSCRPAALDDLLRLRERLPKKDEVNALVERYRRAVRLAPDQDRGGLLEVGVLALGGTTTAAPVAAPAGLARRAAGVAPGDAEKEVEPFADPLGATSETALQEALVRAAHEERGGQAEPARRSFGVVALRAQAAGRAEIEATAQAALMRLEAAAGRPASAVFHGKRAANLLQELRAGVAALPRNERRTYLRERQQVYSRLAQLLMQTQRLLEAERVLQMLKEDEGQQFATGTSRTRYARLPETAQEAAQRAAYERASQTLRRSDDERAVVAADRSHAILLAWDRERIEQHRLRAAIDLHAFLERSAKDGAAEHEKALRTMPLEHQRAFAALFADRGQRLTAMLRALNEDAPQFRVTPATPQQLATIANTLRRSDELRTALEPVLQAMRREPSPTMAQTMDRLLEPGNLARRGYQQMDKQMEKMRQPSPESMAARAQLVQHGERTWAGIQTATGLAMKAYIAALGGQEDRASLAQVEPALKGAPSEALDSYLDFVRQQGQQMRAARQSAPQVRQQLGIVAPEAALAALLGRLRNLVKRSDGAAAEPAPTASAAATPAAPPPAGDSELVSRVQAQLEAAGERARESAGASFHETARPLFAAIAGPKERDVNEIPAIALAEPLGRLWRIDQERVSREARELDTLAQAAGRLESAQDALPATADESRGPLAAASPPTALLYYLPHDNGIDVLLVSAQGRQAWRLPVPRAELEKHIDAFNSAVRDAAIDPRPAANALHQLLFTPVADAVAQTRAEVIALSLSGKLRFVPFAALHDGTSWLAQRYAVAVNPGGRLIDMLKPASARWQVAAFGASQGGASLPPLHSVPQELGMIVQQGQRGALPGRQWLDGAFTAQTLRAALASGNQVVHIASHFKFEPGDAAQSFLLLGDGQRLSLRDLGGPDYRFDRTELVTLSACQTGVSGDDAFGQEVDGLAALLMAQGAPSVLASLWQVADSSTAQLMGAMYGLHARRTQHPLGRAQALQQAQIAMIRGTALAAVGAGSTPDTSASADVPDRGIGRPQDRTAPLGQPALGGAHPYHWAPFVLMGSWQ